ncbi:MAG: UvrD-helicase domain-containing protein [bacterium]
MDTTQADHQDIQLTENQKRAITTLGRNICVSAGAGSGKTTVLVDRYLYLLEHGGMEVNGIAAITFTEKAANQMKEKIRSKIQKKIALAEDPVEKEIWSLRFRDAGSAWIHTIHGLCARLLKENAIEAGIDPSFMTLNQTETIILLHRTVRDFINDRLNHEAETMVRLLTAYGLRRTRETLVRMLEHRDIVSAWSDKYRGLSDEEILEPLRSDARARLQSMSRDLEAISCPDQEDLIEKTRQNAITLLCSRELSADALTALSSITLKGGSKKKWGEEELKHAKALLSELKELSAGLVLLYDEDKVRQDLALLRALISEFDLLNERYRAEKTGRGAVDFDDLLILALGLLKQNPEVRNIYRRELLTLLIDELQDTDRLQMEIVRQIAGDEPGRIFAVGDAKQSIYGFRGADVSVFQAFQQQIRANDPEGVIPLNRNFRSQEEILHFLNHLFSRIFPSRPESDEDILFEKLEPHLGSIEGGHFVECFFSGSSDGEKISMEETRRQESAWIASRIREMVENKEERIYLSPGQKRAVQFGDIAILFRATTGLKIYEGALRQLGIPFTVIGGAGFFEKQEVIDVLNLLRVLLYPEDQAALAGFLRSPCAGIRDETLFFMTREQSLSQGLSGAESVEKIDESERRILVRAREMIGKLRSVRDRIRIPELIGRFLDMSGYPAMILTDPVHGKQRYANLKKLMDFAREFSAKPFFDLSDFVGHIEELMEKKTREAESQVDEETQDTVRILTVHRAKGLEFPVVFLPDLAARDGARSGPIQVHRDIGIGIQTPDDRGSFRNSYTSKRIIDECRTNDVNEEKRLFYVAATRAKDFLVLSGQLSFPKKAKPDSAVPMDWLKQAFGITEENYPQDIAYGDRKIRVFTEVKSPDQRIVEEPTWMETYPGILQGEPAPVQEHDAALAMLDRAVRAPVPPRPCRFTVSQLLAFGKCPRGYELSCLCGITEPSLPDQDLPPTGGKSLGTLVHRILQRWDMDTSSLTAIVDRELHRIDLPAGDKKEARVQSLDLLRRFSAAKTAEDIRKSSEVFTEVPFVFKLGPCQVQGVIDKLFRDRAGHLTLIDYKTDRVVESETASKAGEYRFQLAAYALAAHRLFNEPIETAIVFLHPGVTFPMQTDPDAIEQEILSMVREIQSLTSPFPMCPDRDLCLTCGYSRTFCP